MSESTSSDAHATAPKIAIIDTTAHPEGLPPEHIIGGLTLLERALRLAEVNGFTRAIVLARSSSHPEIGALIDHGVRTIPVEVIAARTASLGDKLTALDDALETPPTLLVWFSSSTVYERRLIKAAMEVPAGGIALVSLEGQVVSDLIGFGEKGLAAAGELLEEAGASDLREFVKHLQGAPIETLVHAEEGWSIGIHNKADAVRAEDKLWQSCRKNADGLVSRHINRYISLWISRRIAATKISPNHISILTFSMGIAAALVAAIGGFWAFALAGLIYQTNSVIDGVDGELARTKYEFSLLGEWLDTLSDDFSDLFIYIGLGIGAWRTVEAPIQALGPELWLWLGGLAALGKVVSMALYYRWLIANKRGDLLSFQWSFEESDEGPPSLLKRALQGTKYFFKKDFIVFVAMLMGLVGALPWLLFLLGPGNIIVAISVATQAAPKTQ